MSLYQRRKGSRGQLEARRLLQDRDWLVSENCAGRACADFHATDPSGSQWAVEVKNTLILDWPRFRKQAKEQARRAGMKWLLMCHVPGSRSWLIEGQGRVPVIWTGKE